MSVFGEDSLDKKIRKKLETEIKKLQEKIKKLDVRICKLEGVEPEIKNIQKDNKDEVCIIS